ncbi:putative zinc-type alcohol dehydrogenase-like protein [Paraburkholderia silvatlantica]|uniref:Putative zinc-type alcohol dehydrogenase-like protein n=1 Tax=Paraburkholderia silvatlantica TaxID=321895 RepID=A0A2V4UBK8_9BURK|nr:NAD(P)-dependent alcohol dehydrogenase [Paraburkholderia silvatlantica]PYE25450.1 putative zinc-type alcohol dehydrogenase-like protein [Paraburkholderia silvatlantica]
MLTRAYAAHSPTMPLAPFEIERREPGPNDVAIDILYCGVCHSDLHTVRGEWPGVLYPSVAGHEIVGRVRAVGPDVTKVRVGSLVGVGCMVDSCRTCAACARNLEQYCENGFIATYNGSSLGGSENTYGGYSAAIVVDEHFVLRITHNENDLAAVAPLLCAGITTWSPLRHWNVGPGMKIGVVGIGGLGHMAIKLAHALGAHVVAFTTSPSKREAALALGADEVVISTDNSQMLMHAASFSFILNTVAASHDLDAFMALLKLDGTMTVVGVPSSPHPSPAIAPFIFKRRSLAGSVIGGIAETQEMLDFCARHDITADIETIAIQDIEAAFARMVKSDVQYRFVIDMATLKTA